MEKKIIVACGTGIATSTVVIKKLEDKLNEANIKFKILQCKASEIPSKAAGCDLIVATTHVDDIGIPVVRTTSFLTGIGIEADIAKIIELLQ